jgi:ubiquinone/menaquinone biosynthesis C-methylase UbiE
LPLYEKQGVGSSILPLATIMKREITGNLLYYIDQITPPVLRRSYLFSKIFKSSKFKEDIISQDFHAIQKFYVNSKDSISLIDRPHDLTKKSTLMILDFIDKNKFKHICDLGGGNLYLKHEIKKSLDIDIDVLDFKYVDDKYGYKKVNLEKKLDFIKDNYYDLTISTHTIEHLLNSSQFLQEIRRISSKACLLVFPKQIGYEHTPDEHINFFPYKFEVEKLFGKINYNNNNLIDLKYDWLYKEFL